jgi:hypothetical protein
VELRGGLREIPRRVDPARRHRRHRRRARWRHSNRRLRQLKRLGRRHPAQAWTGGIASAILIGAVAGLLPAIRASWMPPTVALRTV